MNTHTIIVDMRQDVLMVRRDAGSQNRVVSDTSAFCITNTNHRLDSKQVSNLDYQKT